MLAHLLAVGGALGLAPRLDTGFVDADVNRALGVDAEREAALELLTLGPQGAPAAPVAALEDLRHPYVPLSSSEVDYPLLREIHRASMLHTPDDVRAWREAGRGLGGRPPRPVSPRALVPLPAAREASGRSLGETIQRRGSTRQFGLVPLSAVELATALWSATRSVDADVPTGLVDLYLIVNAVDGVEPGAYHYRPEAHALELLKAGRYRNESAYLCLEYLAAYAQGFGASGLTFYDGHVVEFFSPHAAGKDAIFVVALGRAAGSGRVTIGTTPTLSRRPSG